MTSAISSLIQCLNCPGLGLKSQICLAPQNTINNTLGGSSNSSPTGCLYVLERLPLTLLMTPSSFFDNSNTGPTKDAANVPPLVPVFMFSEQYSQYFSLFLHGWIWSVAMCIRVKCGGVDFPECLKCGGKLQNVAAGLGLGWLFQLHRPLYFTC